MLRRQVAGRRRARFGVGVAGARRPGAIRCRGGVIRCRDDRPRCVPGVSRRPGQAVAATRRPGRGGSEGELAQGRCGSGPRGRCPPAGPARGRHEVGMCDGSSERSRASVTLLHGTWIQKGRSVRKMPGTSHLPGLRGPLFGSPGRAAWIRRPIGRPKGGHVFVTSQEPMRKVTFPASPSRGGILRPSRPSPGAPPSLFRHSPHPRPSRPRPRPRPARAVAETAASLPTGRRPHTAASLTSGAGFKRPRPSPGAGRTRLRPFPDRAPAAHGSAPPRRHPTGRQLPRLVRLA